MVHRAVEAHRGAILVDSGRSGGAIHHLSAGAAGAGARRWKAAEARVGEGARPDHDDERSILDTVQILLRGEGFEVGDVQNPREALERLAELAPDIVLTDIRMPGMTGLEVLAAVRAARPEVPVILMTAQASLQTRCRRSTRARSTTCRSRSAMRSW
jgi:CheY-like chemotaxis protein